MLDAKSMIWGAVLGIMGWEIAQAILCQLF